MTENSRQSGARKIANADRICQAVKKYWYLRPEKDECARAMSTAPLVSLSFRFSPYLVSPRARTLTPNFPRFNPNLTDSPTVCLEYTGTRISTVSRDCLVAPAKPVERNLAEYASISSVVSNANYPQYFKITRQGCPLLGQGSK